jgi:hypothetical protein
VQAQHGNGPIHLLCMERYAFYASIAVQPLYTVAYC